LLLVLVLLGWEVCLLLLVGLLGMHSAATAATAAGCKDAKLCLQQDT
jgi:hypothetical protein